MGFFSNFFGGGASDYNPTLQGAGSLISQGNQLFNQSQNLQSSLSPFYQNLMNNPQGLGATTMNQMQTQSGQSVAGGVGAGRRTATDLASRTGNLSAIPSIIGATTKAGIGAQDSAVNNLNIKNAMEKLSQQQEGAAGLSGLFKQDQGSGLNAQTSGLGIQLNAEKDQNAAQQQGIKNIASLVQGAGDAMSGGMLGPAMAAAGDQGGNMASLFS
jgi:hypothetical protein